MALDDVAMFRAFLGSTVVAPCDANQTASLLDQLVDTPGLSYLRLLRGETPVIYEPGTEFPIGGSVTLGPIDGADAVVIASGVTVHEAIEAADRLAVDGTVVGIIDAYSIKPLDAERVRDAARSSRRIVVVEDHGAQGGLGDAVREALVDAGVQADLIHLAVRDVPASATPAEQRAAARIDASAIVAAITDTPR
jgi:transketolase